MAAKLEQRRGAVWLGEFRLASTEHVAGGWRYVAGLTISTPRETRSDALNDAESEVRRLLKEAGVDCE